MWRTLFLLSIDVSRAYTSVLLVVLYLLFRSVLHNLLQIKPSTLLFRGVEGGDAEPPDMVFYGRSVGSRQFKI